MTYQAILFDLDGTLTDSGEGIMRSVQYALEKMGKPESDLSKLRVFVGPPLKEQFMAYAHLSEEEAVRAVAFYRERFAVTGIYENALYEGVPQLLMRLLAQGCRLGVASSKPEKFVRIVLSYFDIEKYFSVVVGSYMDGRRSKKAEVIEEAVRQLGLEDRREDVLMVGDTSFDIIGAASCGIPSAAVTYGYGSEASLIEAAPSFIASSPRELGDIICGGPDGKAASFGEPESSTPSSDFSGFPDDSTKEEPSSPRGIQKMSFPRRLWRVVYPILLHILITEAFVFVFSLTGLAAVLEYMRPFLSPAIFVTALTSLAFIPVGWALYKRDQENRGTIIRKAYGQGGRFMEYRLGPFEALGLLLAGAGLALCGNIFVGLLQQSFFGDWDNSLYDAVMGHNALPLMLIAGGLITPLAEEILFRWLIYQRMRERLSWLAACFLSSLLFGVYHGNLIQGIYAFLVGCFMAIFMEMSGSLSSCVLLHMGANIFSIIFSEYGTALLGENDMAYFYMIGLLGVAAALCLAYWKRKAAGE